MALSGVSGGEGEGEGKGEGEVCEGEIDGIEMDEVKKGEGEVDMFVGECA